MVAPSVLLDPSREEDLSFPFQVEAYLVVDPAYLVAVLSCLEVVVLSYLEAVVLSYLGVVVLSYLGVVVLSYQVLDPFPLVPFPSDQVHEDLGPEREGHVVPWDP